MKHLGRRILEAVCRIVWPFVLNCNGCGRRFADVRIPPCEGYPRGEGYCWECAPPPLSEVSDYE